MFLFNVLLVHIVATTLGVTQNVDLMFDKVSGHYMTGSYGIGSMATGRSELDCGRRCGDDVTCMGWSLLATLSTSSWVTCELRTHVTGNVTRDLVPNANYNHYCEYVQYIIIESIIIIIIFSRVYIIISIIIIFNALYN